MSLSSFNHTKMDVTQNKGTLFYFGHHKHVFIFFQSHARTPKPKFTQDFSYPGLIKHSCVCILKRVMTGANTNCRALDI
jgi:hypothetical protein